MNNNEYVFKKCTLDLKCVEFIIKCVEFDLKCVEINLKCESKMNKIASLNCGVQVELE